jgi:hypothetical protein
MGDQYASRSEADAAVVAAMVNGGHTDDEIRAVFAKAEWRIGDRYREPAHGDRYLQRTIATARAFVSANPLPSTTPPAPSRLSIPLSAIFSADFPEPKYLVKGLIREKSSGFIGGEPKQFKSMSALDMAISIASGTPVFGHFEVPQPRKVLFVEEEDDHGLLRMRLTQFKLARGDHWPSDENFRLIVRARLRIDPAREDDDGLNPAFRALILDIDKFRPDIVFFDVLNCLHTGEENSQRDMSRVMDQFSRIRQRFGCAVILIHHFNKLSQGKSGRPNQRLRGSSVLPGWSENSLYILRRDRDNTLVVEPESKYGATQPFAIQLEEVAIDGGDTGLRFAFKGDPAGRKQAENREKVFTALTDLQATPDACTIKTLATRLDMSESGVRNCLHELEDLERVGYTESKVGGKGQAQHIYHVLIKPGKDAQGHE